MTSSQVRVIKVGGSLLDLPNLASGLQQWLELQTAAHQILVVGGGTRVAEVRQWYSQNPLCEVPAHWLAIDLMTVTTRTLQMSLPTIALCEDFEQLAARSSQVGATFFAPCRWLHNQEVTQPGTKLPASWDVSSDSIAARLAVVLQAQELVLLKSAAPHGDNIRDMAAEGYVDPMLPRLVHEIATIRFVNFRDELQGV